MRTGAHPYSKIGTHQAPRRFAHYSPTAGAPGDLRGLLAAMRRYLEHRAVLGSTEQGVYAMERSLRDFIAWSEDRGVTHPQQVTRPVLERYQRWLYHYRKTDGAPLSVRSQRTKLIPLKGWFKWLTRSGEIVANPASELDLPREIKTLPRGCLSESQAERVLASVDLGTPIGLRDRTMMEVLYSTGLRRVEIARLAIDDIESERALVLVRQGKGYKDRLIPLGERALHWVHEYLDRSRPQLAWNADDRTLFLGNEGRPLSPIWLSTLIANRVAAAGIGKRGGCHLWRHTMATLMLEHGADLRYVQAMLGHEDIATTQIYTHVAVKQLAAVHARTHPGAKRRERGKQGGKLFGGLGGVQTTEAVPTLQPEAIDAADALLTALDAEAGEEEGADLGAEPPAVAADAPKARR